MVATGGNVILLQTLKGVALFLLILVLLVYLIIGIEVVLITIKEWWRK